MESHYDPETDTINIEAPFTKNRKGIIVLGYNPELDNYSPIDAGIILKTPQDSETEIPKSVLDRLIVSSEDSRYFPRTDF